MDELAKERYDLAVERIREIREEKTVAEPYLEFFTKTAGFLEEMIRLRDRVEAGEMKKLSLEELRRADQENTEPEQFQAMDTTESSTNRFSLMPSHKNRKMPQQLPEFLSRFRKHHFLQASQTLRSEAT